MDFTIIKSDRHYSYLLFFFFFAVLLGILPTISFFNQKLFIVKTGSMVPAIYPGSLILVEKKDTYRKGEIITFRNPVRGQKEMATITHRLQAIVVKDSSLVYMTKGDANVLSDEIFIYPITVIGKVTRIIPGVGFLSNLVRSQIGLILFIILPGTLIILKEVKIILFYSSPNKKAPPMDIGEA